MYGTLENLEGPEGPETCENLENLETFENRPAVPSLSELVWPSITSSWLLIGTPFLRIILEKLEIRMARPYSRIPLNRNDLFSGTSVIFRKTSAEVLAEKSGGDTRAKKYSLTLPNQANDLPIHSPAAAAHSGCKLRRWNAAQKETASLHLLESCGKTQPIRLPRDGRAAGRTQALGGFEH